MVIHLPIAVVGLLALITLTTGAYLISVSVRDIVTGESTPVELAESERIQQIMDDPTLTYEQKLKLIEAIVAKDELTDIMHKVLLIAVVIGVAYVAAIYLRGK